MRTMSTADIVYISVCLSQTSRSPHRLTFTLLEHATVDQSSFIVEEHPPTSRVKHVHTFALQNTTGPEDITYFQKVPLCIRVRSSRPIFINSTLPRLFACSTLSSDPIPAGNHSSNTHAKQTNGMLQQIVAWT